MKLGISTATYFPRFYTEDTFEHIAKAGAGVCELFFQSRSEYTDNFANLLIKKLDKANEIHPLYVHSIHALTNQFEPELFGIMNGRARNDAIETFRRILHVGERIGAKCYSFHGATIQKRAVQYKFDYEVLGQKWNQIYDIAQEYGITLCYENVHWTYFHTPEYFANLKKYIKGAGTVLDIKQAMQSKYDYKDYLKVMSNTLETVHVCDYNNDGTTTIPGRGTFDFVEFFKVLLDQGYDGPVLMELYSQNYESEFDVKESFDYLNVCLDKAKK